MELIKIYILIFVILSFTAIGVYYTAIRIYLLIDAKRRVRRLKKSRK